MPGFQLIDFMGVLEAVDGASLDRLERIIVYGENVDTSALFHGKNRAEAVSFDFAQDDVRCSLEH